MRELVNHSGQMLGEKQNYKIQRLRRNCQEGKGAAVQRLGTSKRPQEAQRSVLTTEKVDRKVVVIDDVIRLLNYVLRSLFFFFLAGGGRFFVLFCFVVAVVVVLL